MNIGGWPKQEMFHFRCRVSIPIAKDPRISW